MFLGERMRNYNPTYIPPSEYKFPDDEFFYGGYAQLYEYKFRMYLSSVSRYLQNKKLTDIPYCGDN